MTRPIVVGLDGSQESFAAVEWAAAEAHSRGLPVHLLHSWTTQPQGLPIAQEARSKQLYGSRVLERGEAEILAHHPGVRITTELTHSPAAQALLRHDEGSAMLVLGSTGQGGISAFLHGSAGLRIVGSALCPVLAVRAGQGHPLPEQDEIVVGVHDPGDPPAALLEFAFTGAQDRSVSVRAVHTSGDERRAEHRAVLEEALGPWREKFPGVRVSTEVRTGQGGGVLLMSASAAQLLVVGRKLHRPPLTWRLGPVTRSSLHHAGCPVAVVPHD